MNTVHAKPSAVPNPDVPREWHLASLIVYTTPENLCQLTRRLQRRPAVEIHASDPAGKLVITLEGESTEQMVSHIEVLRAEIGVLNVQMVYQQVDEAPTEEAL